MKNKNGFTLVELLCVVAILGIITTIASGSVMKLSKQSKEKLYCAKLKIIENSAYDYALKYERELNNSSLYYEGYKSLKIQVKDLIENNNLEPDKNNLVLNPLNNNSLNNQEIIFYLKNNKINIYINDNNIC